MDADDSMAKAPSSAPADKGFTKGKPERPKISQGEPTQARAIDPKNGLELDEHGLPISGPARRRELQARRIADPALSNHETEKTDG